MGLQKGQTNNPAGRPKGKPNRTTTEIKEMINQFISCNLEDLQENYDKMEPEKKLLFLEKLLKFSIPTQSQNEININSLSESELDILVNKILSNLK